MFGFWLITILAVLGGIIAYIGDKIGMKIGRKRLSIFKLRPKHTSTLITVITGILIAGGTLGVMTVASKDVQTALFGMTQLKQELSTLAAKVKGKDLELTVISKNLANARNKYQWVQDLNERLNAKIKQKQELLDKIIKKLDTLATQNLRLSKEKQKLDAGLDSAKADIDKLQRTKRNLEKQIAANEEKLTKLKRIVYGQETYIREQEERLRKAKKDADEWESTAWAVYNKYSDSDIVYRVGSVISYGVITGGGDGEDILEQLMDLARHADEIAGQRAEKKHPLILDQDELDGFVKVMQKNRCQYIVGIVAKRNYVAGDDIRARFEVFAENKLEFRKGDLIYSEIVNGAASTEEVNEEIKKIIRKVSEIAAEKGIIQTTGGSVENIVGLYDTIRQISDAGRHVKISLFADKDIWTVGPLTATIETDFDYIEEGR